MSPTSSNAPAPAYELHRMQDKGHRTKDESLDFSSNAGSESYYQSHDGAGSSATGRGTRNGVDDDATETVHEMHLALLYLLSNPDEFKKALNCHPPRGVTTLSEWNTEIDDEESVLTSATSPAPLPFVVFADDAEVVLPQAHTASQLFGIEQVEGIELEAAAGIPALSQLFLRWLALMPGGDHLNIIDPPGLTVMRIAGGRYRVTAAHRVIWTWMNEFASLAEETDSFEPNSPSTSEQPKLQVGDLVSLTIVDVFETDSQGKLLSYCPTFDNRAVSKTNQTAEAVRKSSGQFFSMLGRARRAVEKSEVNKRASAQFTKMGFMQSARSMAETVRHRVDEAVHQMNSPKNRDKLPNETVNDSKDFEEAMTAAEAAATSSQRVPTAEELASSDVGVPSGMGEI